MWLGVEAHRQRAAAHVEFTDLDARNVLQLEGDVGRSVGAGQAAHEHDHVIGNDRRGVDGEGRGGRAAASGQREHPRPEGERNLHVRVSCVDGKGSRTSPQTRHSLHTHSRASSGGGRPSRAMARTKPSPESAEVVQACTDGGTASASPAATRADLEESTGCAGSGACTQRQSSPAVASGAGAGSQPQPSASGVAPSQ